MKRWMNNFTIFALVLSTACSSISLKSDLEEKVSDPVMGSAAGWTLRLDIDGYFPDEGILVSTTSPDFWKQGPGAFITKPPYLNGKERQKYHRVYILPTGEDWTEHTVTVVPDADGKLTLTCYAVAPGAMNIVHWDDVRVEGATLENGGYEKADEEGKPIGWKLGGWTTEAPKGRYITGADDAAEGDAYVMSSWTWHWSATLSDVKKDQPIILRWKSRFVPPETRYPARVGLNGLNPDNSEKHTAFKMASGMDTDNKAPERYVGRLLDGFDINTYGSLNQVNGALGVYLSEANEEWQERTIQLEPQSDGEIEITLHAARLRDKREGIYKPAYVDYKVLGIKGATLANADMQMLDSDGMPKDWKRVGRDLEFKIVRHESDSVFARTWYQAGLRNTLKDVKKGQAVKIRLMIRRSESE